MTPTVGLNLTTPQANPTSTSLAPTQEGANNAIKSYQNIDNAVSALFKLHLKQREVQNRAVLLDNLNALQDGYNKELLNFKSLKGKDAIDGKDEAVKRLLNVKKTIQERVDKAQPIVQQLFKEKASQIDTSLGANLESYVMQETVTYRNEQLKSSINLASNSAIANYSTNVFSRSMQELNSVIEEFLDANGVDLNSAKAKDFKLQTTSEIHKSAIGNFINLDQLGNARSYLKKYKDQITAADYNSLSGKIFNAQQVLNNKALAQSLKSSGFIDRLAKDQAKLSEIKAFLDSKAAYYINKGYDEDKANNLARQDLYDLQQQARQYASVGQMLQNDYYTLAIKGIDEGAVQAGDDALTILKKIYGDEKGYDTYMQALNNPHIGETGLKRLENLTNTLDSGNKDVYESVKTLSGESLVNAVNNAGGVVELCTQNGFNIKQTKDVINLYNKFNSNKVLTNYDKQIRGSVETIVANQFSGKLTTNQRNFFNSISTQLVDELTDRCYALDPTGTDNSVLTKVLTEASSRIQNIVNQIENVDDFVKNNIEVAELYDEYGEAKVNRAIAEFEEKNNRDPTADELEPILEGY